MNQRITPLLLALILGACQSKHSVHSEMQTALTADTEYIKRLQKDTRSAKIYDQFETVCLLSATYLSREFRQAFEDRFRSLMMDKPFAWRDNQERIGFFVSIFTPEYHRIHLSDRDVWNLVLNIDGKNYQPTLVRYLKDKNRWRPFFTDISPWTREYLLIFDAPNFDSQNLVKAKPAKLSLYNFDVKISLTW